MKRAMNILAAGILSLALCVGITGCSPSGNQAEPSSDPSSVDGQTEASSNGKDGVASDETAKPASELIIGVWECNDLRIAFIENYYYDEETDSLAFYSLDEESSTLAFPGTQGTFTCAFKDGGSTLNMSGGGLLPADWTRTDEDVNDFLKDKVVTLAAGQGFENENIAFTLESTGISQGEYTFVDGRTMSLDAGTALFSAEATVTNKTTGLLFPSKTFVINKESTAGASAMGAAISIQPLQSEYGLFHYEVADNLADSITSMQLVVRYMDETDTKPMSPYMIINLK